jgi:hypothetical protein
MEQRPAPKFPPMRLTNHIDDNDKSIPLAILSKCPFTPLKRPRSLPEACLPESMGRDHTCHLPTQWIYGNRHSSQESALDHSSVLEIDDPQRLEGPEPYRPKETSQNRHREAGSRFPTVFPMLIVMRAEVIQCYGLPVDPSPVSLRFHSLSSCIPSS